MGYLINSTDNFLQIIIPEVFLQSVTSSTSYDINPNLGNSAWFVTFATFRLINSTVNYDGFTHIGLGNSTGLNQAFSETIIYPNSGIIESNFFYSFAYNTQHSPTRLGSYTGVGGRYQFLIDGNYVSGNGDIELTMYYKSITI